MLSGHIHIQITEGNQVQGKEGGRESGESGSVSQKAGKQPTHARISERTAYQLRVRGKESTDPLTSS